MENAKRFAGFLVCAVFLFSAVSAAYAQTALMSDQDLRWERVQAGTTAQEILELLDLPDGAVWTEAGVVLSSEDAVATGMLAGADGQGIPLVVAGDVLGTGEISLSQLIRLAKAFVGAMPLEGIFLEAGDMNENGKIDLTDITMLASLLLTGASSSEQNPSVSASDVMEIINAVRSPLVNPADKCEDPSAKTAARGANEFAFRFTKALLEQNDDSDDNFVCSPYSVWLPLAALLNATDEAAQPALLDAIGAAGLTSEQVNEAASRMLYGLTAVQKNEENAEDGFTPLDPLKIANAIFVDRNETVQPAFADTFASDYLGESIAVDFASGEAADAVNQWCSDNTDGLIPEIIKEFSPDTVAAIANAIYFSDRWKSEFDAEDTKTDVFHAPSADVEAPFMCRNGEMMQYYEDDEVQMVPLRFRTEGGLAVLLPKNGDAEGLLASLTDERFRQMRSEASQKRGDLLLPRFEINCGPMNLNDSLTALGVPLLDRSRPAITELLASEDPLYISQALQSACIKVDEKGTTAAAVTVMAIEATSAFIPPEDTFVMNCNTPFVFVLYGDTYDGGAQILFTGVVNQPETAA